ncbi:MAG: flagellar hook-basal body complex protein [Thermohalobaculum sp.]|nr:flagellar hook-basal body complex protein [Thermohalobaculum sp.]
MDDLLSSVVLNRQRGLDLELTTIANNVANLATAGFRREGLVFSEFVAATQTGDSVSIGDLNGRFASSMPGPLSVTGRSFDLAIEGREGYFMLDRAGVPVLTRAGAFQISREGVLVSPAGEPLLDTGGAPILVPNDAGEILIGADGTIAGAAGPIAQIAVMRPADGASIRAAGAAFITDQAPEPVEGARIRQGALEGSNVDPVTEIARMIEVTRSYERAQALIEDHDSRIRNVLETLGRAV